MRWGLLSLDAGSKISSFNHLFQIFEEDLFAPGSRKEYSYYVSDSTSKNNPSSTPRSPTVQTPGTNSITYSTSSTSHQSVPTPTEDQMVCPAPELHFNSSQHQLTSKEQETPKRIGHGDFKLINIVNLSSSRSGGMVSGKSDTFKDLCENLDTCSRSKALKDTLLLPLPGGRKRSISVLQPERRLGEDQLKRYRRRSLTGQQNTASHQFLNWEPLQALNNKQVPRTESPPVLITPISSNARDESKGSPLSGTESARVWNSSGNVNSRKTLSLSEFQTPVAEPLNPRDHSLLERIYNEMLAARFINLNTLSVIVAQLSLYFSSRSCPKLSKLY